MISLYFPVKIPDANFRQKLIDGNHSIVADDFDENDIIDISKVENITSLDEIHFTDKILNLRGNFKTILITIFF